MSDEITLVDGSGDVSVRALVDRKAHNLIRVWNAGPDDVCGADVDGDACQRRPGHYGDHRERPLGSESLVLTTAEARELAGWLLEQTGGAS